MTYSLRNPWIVSISYILTRNASTGLRWSMAKGAQSISGWEALLFFFLVPYLDYWYIWLCRNSIGIPGMFQGAQCCPLLNFLGPWETGKEKILCCSLFPYFWCKRPAWLSRDHDGFATVQLWLLTCTPQYHLKLVCEGPNDVIKWQKQHCWSVCPSPVTAATIGRISEVAAVNNIFNKINISEALWIYWSVWTPAYERQVLFRFADYVTWEQQCTSSNSSSN